MTTEGSSRKMTTEETSSRKMTREGASHGSSVPHLSLPDLVGQSMDLPVKPEDDYRGDKPEDDHKGGKPEDDHKGVKPEDDCKKGSSRKMTVKRVKPEDDYKKSQARDLPVKPEDDCKKSQAGRDHEKGQAIGLSAMTI